MRLGTSLRALVAVAAIALGAISASADQLAYVPTADATGVQVIDTSTNSVVTNIPLSGWGSEVAITPDGKFVYVTESSVPPYGDYGNTVEVISTATNKVVASIQVGEGPLGVAITPNGQFVYVCNSGWTSVWVIATSTNSVVATITVGTAPEAVVITPDGAFAYVANMLSNTISVIDTTTNTVVNTIPVAIYPEYLAMAPNGATLYVSSYANYTVSVIDTASNTVVNTIIGEKSPRGLVVAPDGAFLYVAAGTVAPYGDGYSVSVIDTASQTLVTKIPQPQATLPSQLAMSPDGAFVYVSGGSAGTVAAIATATNTFVNTIPVGNLPGALVFAPTPNAAVALSSVTVNPSSVSSGTSATGTVTLTGAAPAGGIAVSLWTNGTPAFVPTSVTIPAGSATATFSVTTIYTSSPVQDTITAFYNGMSTTATLTVTPLANVALSAISVNPGTVASETSATGTLTLSAPAPAGGITVSLWTNGSPAFVPTNVTIPAGSITATFPVTTIYTSTAAQDTITAFYNGVSRTATLTVAPLATVALSSVSVNPVSVASGSSATGTVTLSAPAPAGGIAVSLWTNGSPAFVPTSVTIPAGSITATFPVTTIYTSTAVQDTITAFYNGASKTTSLTVTP